MPQRPKEIFDRQRERLLARENFARALQEETKAFRKTEWELRTNAQAARRQQQQQQEQQQQKELEEAAAKIAAAQTSANPPPPPPPPLAAPALTLEERKEQLKARAYALKARNEATRQAFVQECYDRRWRDACDDARRLDGKALQSFVHQEQKQQIQQKQTFQQQQAKDAEIFHRQIEEHVAKMDKAEQAKQLRRQQQKEETVAILKAQIKLTQARKEHEKVIQATEDAHELALIAADLAREEAEAEARKQNALGRGEEVRAFNDHRRGLWEAMLQEEKRQDLLLLQYALEQEGKAEAAEAGKKAKAQEESHLYRQYLQELMLKEAEDEKANDAIRQAKEDEVWANREAALQQRREASAALWQQVDAGRREQIRLQAQALAEEAKLEAAQVDQWKAELTQGFQDDWRAAQERRRGERENTKVLKQQVQERRRREILEAQQEYLARKHMEKTEADHVRRQREQAGIVRLHYPLKTGKWMS